MKNRMDLEAKTKRQPKESLVRPQHSIAIKRLAERKEAREEMSLQMEKRAIPSHLLR